MLKVQPLQSTLIFLYFKGIKSVFELEYKQALQYKFSGEMQNEI